MKYEFKLILKAPKEAPVIETFCNERSNSGQDYLDKQLQASCETKSEETIKSGWAYMSQPKSEDSDEG